MILQSMKMAWKAVASNKMRSLLTMLGIIIGVMALVVLVSLVSTATSSVSDQINSLGTNYLTVTVSDDKGKPFRLSDISDLMDEDEFEYAAPLAQTSVTAESSYSSETATVYGTTGPYFDIKGLTVEKGRPLKQTDVDNHTNVAVINAGLATEVMGRTNCTGESIKLGGTTYTIVGVLESDDSDDSTTETYEAYIPYTSLVRLSTSTPSTITTFYVSAANNDVDTAEAKLTEILNERFNDDEDAYTIMNLSTIAEAMESVTNTMALLLGGIAAISLLVGGIGIMNIMLVSVTERTREIGIRKAIGASRGAIMMQFLIEALVLCLMGCAIGVVLSEITLLIISAVAGDTYTMEPTVVIVSVAFSVLIGAIFGIYPANKAARKKPIDALRAI